MVTWVPISPDNPDWLNVTPEGTEGVLRKLADKASQTEAEAGQDGALWMSAEAAAQAAAAYLIPSRAIALTKSIPPSIDSLRTSGYSSPGDGGGALYFKRQSGDPPLSEDGFTTLDGAEWEKVPGSSEAEVVALQERVFAPPVTVLGTIPELDEDGVTDDPTTLFYGMAPAYTRWIARVDGQQDTGGDNGGVLIANASGQWTYTVSAQSNGAHTFQPDGAAPFAFTVDNELLALTDENGDDPALDYYPDGNIFFANGIFDDTESGWATRIGATAEGNGYRIGPYRIPDAPDLVVNGGPTTDLTGWTAKNDGLINFTERSPSASPLGEIELDANSGNIAGFSQTLTHPDGNGMVGRAFELVGTGRRGTTSNSIAFRASQNTTLSGGLSSSSISSTNDTQVSLEFPGNAPNVGGVNTSAAGNGTAYFKDISVKEILPFDGYVAQGGAVLVEFVLPASGDGGDQVIYQADINSEQGRYRIVRKDDTHVHCIFTTNNTTVADLDLGALDYDAGNPNKVHGVVVGYQTNNYCAALNGGDPVKDTAGNLVGVSRIRLGRGISAGDAFEGSLKRATVFAASQGDVFIPYISARTVEKKLITEGDSYMAVTNGIALYQKLRTLVGEVVINGAVGGSSLSAILSRITSKPWARDAFLMIDDGSANGIISATDSLAKYQQIIDYYPHNKIFIIPSVNVGPAASETPTAYTLMMNAMRDGLAAMESANKIITLDTQTLLKNSSAPGSEQDEIDDASGVVRESFLAGDGLHLNETAIDIIAAASAAKINDAGWFA